MPAKLSMLMFLNKKLCISFRFFATDITNSFLRGFNHVLIISWSSKYSIYFIANMDPGKPIFLDFKVENGNQYWKLFKFKKILKNFWLKQFLQVSVFIFSEEPCMQM